MNKPLKIIITGLLAGFVSEGILGALFVSPFIKSILYNPAIQSQLFIEITPQRNVPVSIIGIIILSIIHAWLSHHFCKINPRHNMGKERIILGTHDLAYVLGFPRVVYLPHASERTTDS